MCAVCVQAQPWECVSCNEQWGRRTRATRLYLHCCAYLHQLQPHVQDMGPTPSCSSKACGEYATQGAQQVMTETLQDYEKQKLGVKT